jgi:leader peptidase (prepilin peptidase)/N-methyltransferase
VEEMQMISMLTIQSVWDWRYRQIPIAITLAGGVMGLMLSLIRERNMMDLCMGLLPGVVCLGLGWITREAIGYGDGFLLCAMGMYRDLEELVGIIAIASSLAGVWGMVLIIFCKKKGKDQIPFVPFLLVASVICMMIQKGATL